MLHNYYNNFYQILPETSPQNEKKWRIVMDNKKLNSLQLIYVLRKKNILNNFKKTRIIRLQSLQAQILELKNKRTINKLIKLNILLKIKKQIWKYFSPVAQWYKSMFNIQLIIKYQQIIVQTKSQSSYQQTRNLLAQQRFQQNQKKTYENILNAKADNIENSFRETSKISLLPTYNTSLSVFRAPIYQRLELGESKLTNLKIQTIYK